MDNNRRKASKTWVLPEIEWVFQPDRDVPRWVGDAVDETVIDLAFATTTPLAVVVSRAQPKAKGVKRTSAAVDCIKGAPVGSAVGEKGAPPGSNVPADPRAVDEKALPPGPGINAADCHAESESQPAQIAPGKKFGTAAKRMARSSGKAVVVKEVPRDVSECPATPALDGLDSDEGLTSDPEVFAGGASKPRSSRKLDDDGAEIEQNDSVSKKAKFSQPDPDWLTQENDFADTQIMPDALDSSHEAEKGGMVVDLVNSPVGPDNEETQIMAEFQDTQVVPDFIPLPKTEGRSLGQS